MTLTIVQADSNGRLEIELLILYKLSELDTMEMSGLSACKKPPLPLAACQSVAKLVGQSLCSLPTTVTAAGYAVAAWRSASGQNGALAQGNAHWYSIVLLAFILCGTNGVPPLPSAGTTSLQCHRFYYSEQQHDFSLRDARRAVT